MTAKELRAVYADARLSAAASARRTALQEYGEADLEFRIAWGALSNATAERLTRACRAEQAREQEARS